MTERLQAGAPAPDFTLPDADGKPIFRRVIRTKPHPDYDAGDRTGRLPETIDLDFAKFEAAFDRPEGNQQKPDSSERK